MKTRIMFDSNAYDKLSLEENLQRVLNKLDTIEIIITDTQLEELAQIPDSKMEKRVQVFKCICKLHPTMIPHNFTFDSIDFSHFSFETEPKYDIIKEKHHHVNDAIISATAIHENCTLVTDDIKLLRNVKAIGDRVISFDEFLNNLEKNILS